MDLNCHRLVATLGSKSSVKKVNRKEILEVDVPKACDTIITPQAPMALRLQSSLLFVLKHMRFSIFVLTDAVMAFQKFTYVAKSEK